MIHLMASSHLLLAKEKICQIYATTELDLIVCLFNYYYSIEV